MNGLGDSAQAQSAASYAAAGAKVGSVVPGIGTVIGAVVGAVVGWLAGKKKPPRPSAEQLAQCKTLVNEYMGYAAQMPSQPIPLDYQQLIDIHWCFQAMYGAKYIGVKDPRWFNPGVEAALFPAARQIVKKIYETPVGAEVTIDAITFNVMGKSLTFKGFNFVNPQFTDLKSFTANVWKPLAIQYCQNTAGKGAPGCPDYYNLPDFSRWLYDVIAWAARTELPNISEEDLKAASAVAVTVPGSSAKDVVSAVEQILGQTVKRGETAAVLTPATGPPPALPIVPTGTPSTGTPATGVVPLPAVTPLLPTDTTTSLLPSMPNSLAPYQPTGFTPSPQASKPATSTTASISSWYENPLVLGGGALAAFLLLSRKKRRA